jgi:multidrug efflux pump subunit AcrB
MEALLIGALLAVFVVWLFLRDWRATLVSAVAMPMSLLPTFYVMHLLNQSFNIVTLLALSLTVGILVDDAIVEIENIVRHMREGKKPYQAANEAADEIGLAVVATTATLIAVFAPTGFMPGIVGQFFKSFAIASCVSVFFSLVVARTLTPLMGAYLLRTNPKHDNDKPFWMDGYQAMLKWCLEGHLKWRWYILMHGLLISVMLLIQYLTKSAVPMGIAAAIVLAVTLVLFFVLYKPYMKARWAALEFGLLFSLGILAMGAGFIFPHPGPDGVIVKPGTVSMIIGGVIALIGMGGVLGTIMLTIKLKTSLLRARWAPFLGGIMFFIGSIVLLQTIPSDNIPADDQSMSVMSLKLTPGTPLQETDTVVKHIVADLETHKEVRSTYAVMNMESATVTVNLVPKKERKLTQTQFEQMFSKTLAKYPGIHSSFGQDGGGGTGVAYILASDNEQLLASTSQQLLREMAALKELTNVHSEDNLVQPEVVITPKPDQAALMGVSTETISSAARVATMGDIDQILAKYNDGDRQIPIRVLLKADARYDINNLNTLMVPTRSGTSVPLTAVANISFGAGPIQINRIDRTRSATVNGDLNGVPNGTADAAVMATPTMVKLKKGEIPGVRIVPNPNTEDFLEMVPNFIAAILTGIALMYVVLVLLFGSFSHPFTILLALPLCFGGAFIGLILAQMSMSMPTYIGLIMLVGIAAKNSILLVEYAMVAIKGGMERTEALFEAAKKRARPIVMTTVAMGAGMIPVAVGNDAFRQPMAVTVIGGLITSTLLSLVFVPATYTIIDEISHFFGKMISPMFHAQGKDEPEETTAE